MSTFVPWISFLAGLGGSLHCIGMCGGLVSASCSQSSDIIRYQFGRLLGYLLLGLLGALIGGLISGINIPLLSVISSVLIGSMFVLWGLEGLIGQSDKLAFMHRFSSKIGAVSGKLYGYLWKRLVFKNQNFSKAFFTGAVSIFLPCGLLYGIVLSQAAMVQASGHYYMIVVAMFFFWLGTLPSMVLAPNIFQKIMAPLRSKMPKVFAISLMLIGVSTISWRMLKLNDPVAHAGHQKPLPAPAAGEKLKCH